MNSGNRENRDYQIIMLIFRTLSLTNKFLKSF